MSLDLTIVLAASYFFVTPSYKHCLKQSFTYFKLFLKKFINPCSNFVAFAFSFFASWYGIFFHVLKDTGILADLD